MEGDTNTVGQAHQDSILHLCYCNSRYFPPVALARVKNLHITQKNIAKEHLRGVCQHNTLGHPATESQEFNAKEI